MTHFNPFRRPGLLVSLLGLSSFALFGAACSGNGTPDEHVDSAESALIDAQCAYFNVNGKNQICHHTGSASHPYTIIKTSEQGCINGHAGHAGDYITSTDPSSSTYDPTCQGGGCLPAGAPTDATLACCDGLISQNGTCVDPCASNPCQNGGACGASATGYTCACAPGFTGTNCETPLCVPTTCAAQGAACGTIPDGCGGTLTCGSCASGSTCQSGTCQPTAPACPCAALPGWLDFNVSNTFCINYGPSLPPGSVYLYLKDNTSSRGIAVQNYEPAFEEASLLCGVVGPNNVGNQFITLTTQAQVDACVQSLSQVAAAGGVSCP